MKMRTCQGYLLEEEGVSDLAEDHESNSRDLQSNSRDLHRDCRRDGG
jgi:hypothetical protein